MKPPRTCIFCRDRKAKITVEDVIPKWFVRIRQREGILAHHIGPEANPRIVLRPMKLGVRAVCGKCNNEWMSRIQEAASAHLKGMSEGHASRLDRQAQTTIAAWVAMTAVTWLAAASPALAPTTLPADVHSAGASGRPPDGIAVWIGRYVGHPRVAGLHPAAISQVRAVEGTTLQVDTDSRAIGVTLTLGDFVAQMSGHNIKGAHLEIRLGDAGKFFQPIWPSPTDQIDWPPKDAIDEPTLVALERAFDANPWQQV